MLKLLQKKTVIVVGLVATAGVAILLFIIKDIAIFGTANIIVVEAPPIQIQAQVCQAIENAKSQILNLENNNCSSLGFKELEHISGYPQCHFTNTPEYTLQVATDQNFLNIIHNQVTFDNPLEINNLPAFNEYFYRVKVRDIDRPNNFSKWSEIATCINQDAPPAPPPPAISKFISGFLSSSQLRFQHKPVIFNRKTVFTAKCSKPQRLTPPIFRDLPSAHPSFDLLTKYYQNHIVDGYPNNLVKPDRAITRAEALKIVLLVPCEPLIYETAFQVYKDVSKYNWYSDFVWTATHLGITQGYRNTNTFLPHQAITRAEAIKIIIKSLLPPHETLDSTYINIPSRFHDVTPENWYFSLINFANHHNLLPESNRKNNDYFYPNSPITRIEFVQILDNILQYNWLGD